MKILSLLSLIFLFTAFTAAPPKKVVFFGDSITQAGVRPGGYITLIQEMLKDKGMQDKYQVFGEGIGGNKVYDLYLRMEDDVFSHNPDHVFIYIGVNDVWHKASHGTGTDADKFKKFYQALIDKMKAKGIQLTICTPATIGERTDHSNSQDGDLNYYSNMIRDLAKENNCDLIDLRKEFTSYNLKNNPENLYKGVLTSDGVHLNDKGNKMVADLMFANMTAAK
ncbi:Lysophospholipase L1 [Spirosomataceae bacterium TFI 002]|nr:Lysophospholipase L1 [Spirosomataceae bacterium TFI 002]